MPEYLFSYDDICLRPEYSDLPSRGDADTSSTFLHHTWKIPVVPANMQDVISIDRAKSMSDNGYFYIMHRFGNFADNEVLDNYGVGMSISVGVKDADKALLNTSCLTPAFITIDVAHAHHKNVADMLKYLHNLYLGPYTERPKFIAGNVATADGYKFLCDLGVDAVKVGIGGGSICTTRYKTGFHIPTAYSVWDCATNGDRNVPIIADGGARHFGDVAKALVLGADMVMSGRWFAECLDSPARIEHGKKVYRGSTSYESKGHNNHVEGQTIEISQGCSYPDRLEEIRQALASSISYAGGKDLSVFRNTKWYLCRH